MCTRAQGLGPKALGQQVDRRGVGIRLAMWPARDGNNSGSRGQLSQAAWRFAMLDLLSLGAQQRMVHEVWRMACMAEWSPMDITH